MRLRYLLTIATFALLVPQAAFARGEFDPTTEFEQHEWIPIHLGPLNLSITKAVVYLMLGTVLTILMGVGLMRVKTPGQPPDDRRADLRGRADAGRGAGPADQGDRPLVPVRRDDHALHLGRQHARLHPVAADG